MAETLGTLKTITPVDGSVYAERPLAWSGVKDSGRGCTLSALGYDHLTQPKSFHLRTKI